MSDDLFQFVRSRYPGAGVAWVRLEGDTVVIATARPGRLIGKEGVQYEQLCTELATLRGVQTEVKLSEIRQPELEPVLVADDVAMKLSRGRPPEILELIAEQCLRLGAKGCRIEVSGAVTRRCERGTFELPTTASATSEAVMEPPFEVDDDGNEIPPPPQPEPPPKVSVRVSLCR